MQKGWVNTEGGSRPGGRGRAMAITLEQATIAVAIRRALWCPAFALAETFVARMRNEAHLTKQFVPRIAALEGHFQSAKDSIDRIA